MQVGKIKPLCPVPGCSRKMYAKKIIQNIWIGWKERRDIMWAYRSGNWWKSTSAAWWHAASLLCSENKSNPLLHATQKCKYGEWANWNQRIPPILGSEMNFLEKPPKNPQMTKKMAKKKSNREIVANIGPWQQILFNFLNGVSVADIICLKPRRLFFALRRGEPSMEEGAPREKHKGLVRPCFAHLRCCFWMASVCLGKEVPLSATSPTLADNVAPMWRCGSSCIF